MSIITSLSIVIKLSSEHAGERVRRSSSLRSILRLGKSSYVVTLPHDWLRLMGLRRGDKVLLVTNQDGSLALYPMTTETAPRISLVLEVNADSIQNPRILERILVGAYLEGVQKAIFKTGNPKDPKFKRLVEISQKFVGARHIIHPDAIEFEFQQNFETDFTNLIIRLSASLLSMIAYIKRAINGKPELLKNIERMENDVDRDYLWALRILIASQVNRGLAINLGFRNPGHIIGNRAIIRALELSGDYAYEVAQDLTELTQNFDKIPEDAIDIIMKAIDRCEDLISHSIYALHALDPIRASDNLDDASTLRQELRNVSLMLAEKVSDKKLLVYLTRLTSRLIDIVESVSTINEVIINRCVGSEETVSRFRHVELRRE